MKINLEQNSIMKRLVILFVTIICLVWVLSVSYVINTVALKNDLTTIEDFYNLFNNVLELRRYEKNILLGTGADEYNYLIYYYDAIENDSTRLQESIDWVMGYKATNHFHAMLAEYRDFVEHGKRTGELDVSAIREKGKKLVEFTHSLLDQKKLMIHRSLHGTMILVVVVTVGSFLGVLLVFYLQAKNVLKRLDLLRLATKDVIAGSFTSLPVDEVHKDEISGLIHAFNKMIREIDTKQEQLLQARKLASIGTFSSGIAHELNNPLNNISLTADTIKEEGSDLSEVEKNEMIDDIIHETDRASKIVRNLLDFCREQTSKDELIDLKKLIQKTILLIQNQLTLHYVWVEDYIPADLPKVKGDRHSLQQAFLNLFLNSLQVMDKGGLIHLEGSVNNKGYVHINVNDTGSGIPPEQLEHVFDPFFTTKPVGKGTGLGLSIVYGIIKKHGGTIEVRSKINVGTTFSIHLPIEGRRQS